MNSDWNRKTLSDYDLLEDHAEAPHQFPSTKINPIEGPDLEGMEDPFGVEWETI